MSFLHRRRSLQVFHNTAEEEPTKSTTPKPGSLIPSSTAVENVPQKRGRYRTTSGMGASHIIRRVSKIFVTRKKPPPNLKLVDNSLHSNSRPRSFSSSQASLESEDDIRRPSGLGSAVSIHSNQSLPPSPFQSSGPQESYTAYHTFTTGEPQRTRALSSPNLLRSLSWKVRAKVKARHTSIAPSPTSEKAPTPISSKTPMHVPEEIVHLIVFYLPQQDVARSATVSWTFASAARMALYTSLDFDSFRPEQSEILIAQLASRRDLTDLVTTFICRKWPPFFLPGGHGQNTHSNRVINHQDALLTATFTLVLERMSNLHSLTLPFFDMSLLSHYTPFSLKSLTFLNHTSTEAENQLMFAWLDGQSNITCLRLSNLEDTPTKSPDTPHEDSQLITTPPSPFLKPSGLSPHCSPTPSSRSTKFLSPPSVPTSSDVFTSSTLLPHLTTLHATPAMAMSLLTPLESSLLRPLKSVTLNINTTLFTGLRPAALMCSFRGIEHLALRFSENVDRRSLEKVVGAAGASLGLISKTIVDDGSKNPPSNERFGLLSLEISFQNPSTAQSGRDEALFKSLHTSLARYKTLVSLRLFVESPEKPHTEPTASELILIDSWVKVCPTLQSVTLLSGSRWQQSGHPLKTKEPKVFKFP